MQSKIKTIANYLGMIKTKTGWAHEFLVTIEPTEDDKIIIRKVISDEMIEISLPKTEEWGIDKKVSANEGIITILKKLKDIDKIKIKDTELEITGTLEGDIPTVTVVGLMDNEIALDPFITKDAQSIDFLSDPELWRTASITVESAAAEHDNRPHLSSVYFGWPKENDENIKINIVSTDGHRLSGKILNLEKVEENFILVPSRRIYKIATFSEKEDFNILVDNEKKLLIAKFTDDSLSITYVTKIIDATFPPYKDVIPKDYNISLKVNAGDLLNGLKYIQNKNNSGVLLKWDEEKGKARLESLTYSEDGIHSKVVFLEANLNGNWADIPVSVRFLTIAVQQIIKFSEEEDINIVIKIADNTPHLAPILIKNESAKDFYSVLMPLRL